MSYQRHRLIKPFLLMAFSLFLITACNIAAILNPDTSAGYSKPASECRFVQHKVGESCIPVQPRRIIALEVSWILDPLLSLGIKPVGTVSSYSGGREYFPGLSADEIAGIENVGTPSGPSIEKILKLKPDLILSLDFGEQIYDQLSTIAPTVVREYEKIKFSFKENFRSIAQLVGRERKAEEVLAQYQERIERLRELLKNQPYNPEVSIINYLSGTFLSPPSYAPFFQVLSDIGVRLKPVFLQQDEYLPFSLETINKYDADVLFIVDFDGRPASFFWQNPLISSLNSAQNNRAYLVEADIWWSYGPLGINKLLDELPKYLLEGT